MPTSALRGNFLFVTLATGYTVPPTLQYCNVSTAFCHMLMSRHNGLTYARTPALSQLFPRGAPDTDRPHAYLCVHMPRVYPASVMTSVYFRLLSINHAPSQHNASKSDSRIVQLTLGLNFCQLTEFRLDTRQDSRTSVCLSVVPIRVTGIIGNVRPVNSVNFVLYPCTCYICLF